jgi:hypothetical protein
LQTENNLGKRKQGRQQILRGIRSEKTIKTLLSAKNRSTIQEALKKERGKQISLRQIGSLRLNEMFFWASPFGGGIFFRNHLEIANRNTLGKN